VTSIAFWGPRTMLAIESLTSFEATAAFKVLKISSGLLESEITIFWSGNSRPVKGSRSIVPCTLRFSSARLRAAARVSLANSGSLGANKVLWACPKRLSTISVGLSPPEIRWMRKRYTHLSLYDSNCACLHQWRRHRSVH